MARSIFFFGSLRDDETRRIVLGPALEATETVPARLPGMRACPVKGEDYPVLVQDGDAHAEGILVRNIDDEGLSRLRYFEDDGDYQLIPCEVETDAGSERAHLFDGYGEAPDPDRDWTFEHWRESVQPAFVEAARELMAHYGTRGHDEVDRIWPGIRMRAYARAAARTETRPERIARSAGRSEVRIQRHDIPYAEFFAVERVQVAHRRFDGRDTGTLDRAVWATGDAVTLLPYDPDLDRVLLLEQFRVGPHLRGDRRPWLIEPIAGLIDSAESPEETARREALEEAGLELGQIELVSAHYPSPGTSTQFYYNYVAQAALGDAGGLHGLESENEDIRSFTVSFDEALEGVDSGEIAVGPLAFSIYWLARHRDRLRESWVVLPGAAD